MYSDDYGQTWQLGGDLSGPYLSSECQAVQFENGTVFINARTNLPERVQAVSYDDGITFEQTEMIKRPIIEPLGGCEGSTIRHPLNNWLFFSIPNNVSAERYNVSIWISTDDASSWEFYKVIEPGKSAYSALAVLPDNSVALLFERSKLPSFIFIPEHISFTIIWTPSSSFRNESKKLEKIVQE